MSEKSRVTVKPEAKSENSVFHALRPNLSQSTHSPFVTRSLITKELPSLTWEDRTSHSLKGHPSSIPEGHDFSKVRIHPKGAVWNPPIQKKPRINEPGDLYEQEADRVAEQVMRMGESDSQPSFPSLPSPHLQRQETEEPWYRVYGGKEINKSDDYVAAGISQKIGDVVNHRVEHVNPGASYTPPDGWDLDCFIRRDGSARKFPGKLAYLGFENEMTAEKVKLNFPQHIKDAVSLFSKNQEPVKGKIPVMQRAAYSQKLVYDTPVNEVIRSGAGHPLDNSTRAFMESKFVHDFSQVRVHTDAKAAEAARAVNARAFTTGRDVVFGTGEYAPGTGEGQRLLAHELTHVLQQSNVTLQSGVDTAQSHDGIGYEDNVAKSVSQGKLMPSAPLHVQRFPGLCDPYRPVDCFIQQFIGQIPQLIEEATIGQVEQACQWVIEVTGADAVVFSLSGQFSVGLAIEGGAELIYARNLGWLTYGHLGPGLATPGLSGAIEVGLIWNLTDPGAYNGQFMELAVGFIGSFSFSGNPSDSDKEEESPQGIKFGIGTPGAAILYEQYWQISGQRKPAVAR